MDKFNWLLKGKVLKGGVLSEDWLYICEAAAPLNYYDLGEITALVEMPCDLGTLVVMEGGIYCTEEEPVKVIERWCRIHRFVKAQLKPSSLETVSLVSTAFCLSATPNSNGSLWINPLHIHQLYCGNEGVLVELDNGLSLELSTNCHDFLQQAVGTVYLFISQKTCGSLPLPATPFGYYLEKQLRTMNELLPRESDLVKKLFICPQALKKSASYLVFTVDNVAPSPCTTTA